MGKYKYESLLKCLIPAVDLRQFLFVHPNLCLKHCFIARAFLNICCTVSVKSVKRKKVNMRPSATGLLTDDYLVRKIKH